MNSLQQELFNKLYISQKVLKEGQDKCIRLSKDEVNVLIQGLSSLESVSEALAEANYIEWTAKLEREEPTYRYFLVSYKGTSSDSFLEVFSVDPNLILQEPTDFVADYIENNRRKYLSSQYFPEIKEILEEEPMGHEITFISN